MVEIKASENVDSEFTFHEKVDIVAGYYKGNTGRIKSFDSKTKKYDVEIEVNDRQLTVICNVEQLKHQKGFWNFI